MDLELLNFTPEKLLLAVRRATRARYRYVNLCAARGVRVDVPVEHQLTNHVNLLQDLAQAAGVDSERVMNELRLGIQQAREETDV